MRRWQVRQTCNMVEPPAYSRSGQTWAEACQACLPPSPDCSHSPPCRTHDSAPVLSYHKMDSQINYTKRKMSTSSPASSSLRVAVARRSNLGPAILCSLSRFSSFSWRKNMPKLEKKTIPIYQNNNHCTLCFLILDTTNQCAIAPVIVGVWWPDKISLFFGKHRISWNATIFSRKR